jgi:chemotaxis protein MotB
MTLLPQRTRTGCGIGIPALGLLIAAAVAVLAGCVVTKQSYNQLLNDLTATQAENETLSRELTETRRENERIIAEQKNRIASLQQELQDLTLAYEDRLAANAARRAELSDSLEVLREESSEETQDLLRQIVDLQDRYDTDIEQKNQTIERLKATHREDVEALNNRLDHEIQSNKLLVERLLGEIDSLEALTAEQKAALGRLETQADQLELQLKEEIEKGEIRLKRYKTKTIINIDNSILFDSGRASLKQEVKKSLLKIAGALNKYPENNIQIEGHTDDVPINTPQYPSNWELSAARAIAVLRFFVEESSMDPRRLSAVGLGKYHPLAPNDSPENRRLNRRVDIVILPQ